MCRTLGLIPSIKEEEGSGTEEEEKKRKDWQIIFL
jgi:hypothetical protein